VGLSRLVGAKEDSLGRVESIKEELRLASDLTNSRNIDKHQIFDASTNLSV
jgi:hypothetical protein